MFYGRPLVWLGGAVLQPLSYPCSGAVGGVHAFGNRVPVLALLACAFVASFLTAEVFSWCVERPAIDLSRYIGGRLTLDGVPHYRQSMPSADLGMASPPAMLAAMPVMGSYPTRRKPLRSGARFLGWFDINPPQRRRSSRRRLPGRRRCFYPEFASVLAVCGRADRR